MFLHKILPPEGYFCVATLLPGGGFRHYWHDSIDEAGQHARILSGNGENVYIAQAAFNKEAVTASITAKKPIPFGDPERSKYKERSQANATYLKSFFLDIDCGEKWPLKNQKEGVAALNQFISDTGLPYPAVLSSGNGLYAYWIMSAPVLSAQWTTVARILKQVVNTYSPAIGGDGSRTSDSASVLRPEGTVNRKPGKEPKPVVLLKDFEPMPFLEFAKTLGIAAKKGAIAITQLSAPKATKDLNADLLGGMDGPKSEANKVAEKCAQIRHIRDTKGNVEEPLWYAALGVISRCEDGDNIAQDWSSGHPSYSPAETAAKIQQWITGDIGPSTCATFGQINPGGCVGCPHIDKIKSPIILGRPDPKEIIIPEEQVPPPEGFIRSKEGVFADVDGRMIRIYPRDLYVKALAYDESLGYEVMTIAHDMAFGEQSECVIRSSLIHDKKALLMALGDQHIKVTNMNEEKYMPQYIKGYQRMLDDNRKVGRLMCQMGWKEAPNGDPMFVLGRKIYRKGHPTEEASFAKNVPEAAKAFHSRGSLEKWVEATKVFSRPGMEPFAFAFLATGFGAPLMKFTGFEGALISMVGPSGTGKTLTLRAICSIWGRHTELLMLRGDTQLSLLGRLGVYGNLPMAIDEMSNADGEALSEMTYQITQGRERTRLTQKAVERSNNNKWSTLAACSSNASLIDKLSGAKLDSSAEMNRIFEFQAPKVPGFENSTTTDFFWAITDNYGLAGEKYAEFLVEYYDKLHLKLQQARESIELKMNLKGEERFWGSIIAVAAIGGMLAEKAGLLGFPLEPVFNWASGEIASMRANKEELSGDPVEVLALFLNQNTNNRLIVTQGRGAGAQRVVVVEMPRGALHVRVELHTKRMYISRAEMNRFIGSRFGSYSLTKSALLKSKILIGADKRRTLGAGTIYAGAQQPCWEIDLANKKLGELGEEVLEFANKLAETNEKLGETK